MRTFDPKQVVCGCVTLIINPVDGKTYRYKVRSNRTRHHRNIVSSTALPIIGSCRVTIFTKNITKGRGVYDCTVEIHKLYL
jgi:hypothetical protein